MTTAAKAPVGLSVTEAAAYASEVAGLSVSRSAVERALAKGELVCAWATGSARVLFADDVAEWVEAVRGGDPR
jgi:excisionase family DNA binding protein